jgi:hypothetical protein
VGNDKPVKIIDLFSFSFLTQKNQSLD